MLVRKFLPRPRRLGSFLMTSRIAGRIRCPARAFCPLVPRPEVLPRFPPRPTRLCRVGLFLFRTSWSCILYAKFFKRLDGRLRVIETIFAAGKKLCSNIPNPAELENRAH